MVNKKNYFPQFSYNIKCFSIYLYFTIYVFNYNKMIVHNLVSVLPNVKKVKEALGNIASIKLSEVKPKCPLKCIVIKKIWDYLNIDKLFQN